MSLTLPVALRDSLRALRRSRLFATMSVLSLGLALTLNTTMFALVDATLRPSVPYDIDRLYHLNLRSGGQRGVQLGFHERIAALRDDARAFERVSWGFPSFTMVQGGAGEAEETMVYRVPFDYFDAVGVRPLTGRTIAPGERDAAVISFAAWRRMYAGRPLADGLRINVGSESFAVVGVMPRGMHFPSVTSGFGGDVWILASEELFTSTRIPLQAGWTFARVKPGVSAAGAQAEADLAARRLELATNVPGYQVSVTARPARGDPARLSGLYRLLGASVLVVLLIACANLATLMLARGVARRREVALRMALGATRGHVMRGVLVESGVLAFGGALLGALLTLWALYVVSTQGVRHVPSLGDIAPVPSWRVFLFMLVAAVVAMVLCAALPAVRMAQADPASAIGDGSGTTTARTRERHGLLVVVQVALAMSLLLGAGFLVYHSLRLRGWSRQFDARRLLVASTFMRERDLAARDAARFWYDVETRVRAVPGVEEAATFRDAGPTGGLVTAEQGRSGETWMNLRGYRVVSPTYLRALGAGILQGRDFQPGDRIGTGAVIVDEDAARRLWPDMRSPVGRMLKLGAHDRPAPWVRVIGVTRRVSGAPVLNTGVPPEPDIYYLPPADSARDREVLVRAARRNDHTLPLAVRQVLVAATAGMKDRGGGWARVSPFMAGFAREMEFIGFLASLFGSFGAFALLLSAAGLYGVLGYMVSRRLREFAVRVALGATPRNVGGIVLRQAAVLTLAGVGIGALLTLLGLFRLMDFMFASPWTMAIVLVLSELVVFVVALLAAGGPIRRASRADPLEIMRAN